jgi:hypothetical protein
MVIPPALFLIPLTRFPAFVWLIAAGFLLPKSAWSSATIAGGDIGLTTARTEGNEVAADVC